MYVCMYVYMYVTSKNTYVYVLRTYYFKVSLSIYVCMYVYIGGRWCGCVVRTQTKCALSRPGRFTTSRATLTRWSPCADTTSCPSLRCVYVCTYVFMYYLPCMIIFILSKFPMYDRIYALPEMKSFCRNAWGLSVCMYVWMYNIRRLFLLVGLYWRLTLKVFEILKYSMYVCMY